MFTDVCQTPQMFKDFRRCSIVFSDVYHVKDEGDPQYYLDLIFEASKRIGIDLDIYGAGLTDGKYKKD